MCAKAMTSELGLALALDRHAKLSSPPNSAPLRELAVQRWGNPWLPGNAMRWARVDLEARAMVTEWLKIEFVRDFFTLVAENHSGDARRLGFWERYVSAIDEIHFAVGTAAQGHSSRDYVAMRKPMDGLILPLQDPVGTNNAFIMRIDSLVVVEFSGFSNACYGYKATGALPFVLDCNPLTTPKDAPNSLKHSRRALWLQHQDGIKGFDTWEQRFEAELAEYGIFPKPGSRSDALPRASQSKTTTKSTGKPSPSGSRP